jgi:hypothetical protein
MVVDVLGGLGAQMMINTTQQDTRQLLALTVIDFQVLNYLLCSESFDAFGEHTSIQRLLRLSSNLP